MWITLIVLLSIFSYFDLREKCLPVWLVLTAACFSVIAAIVVGIKENRLLFAVSGMLPGVLLCLTARVTENKIGYGDGMALLIIGNLAGIKWAFLILMLATGGAFLFSCLLLVFGKKSKNYAFPFLPFYLGGTLLSWFWRYGAL